ncbi:hypothetical protein ROHU_027707 [Labeo rohita]|uniref:Ubiquitin-like domain-containing protein n=1 Tax=Labeo rohita TaxID=84645 RepID=A0A498M5D7_LABRO|nr:hypothetical protein ROHU_027707 [Labeo rohita]
MAAQDGSEVVGMEAEVTQKVPEVLCEAAGQEDAAGTEQASLADGESTSAQPAAVSNGEESDEGKEMVDVKIIWNKNKYDLKIPLDGTGAKLKEKIHTLTGLPPAMQKVMYKGLLPEDKTLREIKVTNGAKIMVVGSTINDVLAVNTPKEVIQQEVKAEENKKEPLCRQKQHRKVLDKGKPDDVMPSIKGAKERLPTVPLSGMYNKSGGKVRLTFKLEQDQLWIGTKERTEKIPMGSIKNVVTEPIEGHEDYHMMCLVDYQNVGCVNSTVNVRDWFQLYFQKFSASAALGDFIALNPNFDGLLVLDLLTPEQKAELIFQLEASAKLDLSDITQIFQSFLQPLTNVTLNITSVSSNGLEKNLTDFLVSLRPLGRFIRSCVIISQTTNVSSIRNETIQLLVNWTETYVTQTLINTFNISSFSDWFQYVVLPIVRKALLTNQTLAENTTEIYNYVFYVELNNNFGLMDSATQRSVLNDFILPFLFKNQNTGVGCTLPFNNSVDFILQNFGNFSTLALLQDFSTFSRNFSAVDALPVLTLAQLGELVFSPPARPEDRGNILTRVFDFLLQSSNRDKLKGFIPSLQTQARKANFSCENYRVIFDRMDQALSPLAPNQTEALLTIRDSVMMIPPDECIERTAQCTTIPVNESVLCANVSSSALDQFLSGTAPNTTGICDFTVLQFACLPTLSQLNSQQVADLFACKLSSNVTKETWKLFFTKISTNLDDALVKFSNKTLNESSVALSDVLDVIADARISRFSPQRLRDPVFIQSWFQGRLKAFLPSVSQRLLSCFSTRNFTCESYRTIYVELNSKFGLMDSATQRFVLNEFIRPFLSRQYNTGVQCTLPFNNSVDFILQNFGSFSPLALLQDFSSLSRNFSAVDALPVLTLAQLGELVFSPPARPEDRGNILTRVFDFLLQSSNRDKLNGFIPSLQTQARKANFSCENYRVIFDRMDQALSPLAPNQTEALLTIRDSVMMIPPDECIERTAQCTTIPVNESVLCANVSSSALDQFLSGTAPNTTGICDFTVLQFACLPTLSQLNSQQVADLLACKLSSNVTKETWKLFFTKISTNLDDALVKFSNKTLSASSGALSDVLDVIADTRISRFSPQRLRDPVFIQSWFQGRLKAFLPSVSQRLVSCFSTRNFTCESYRTIYVELNSKFGLMDSATQRFVLNEFIRPFLSRQYNTGVQCTLPFNNSVDFILQNFGSFSPLALLQDFSSLSRNFSAVDALPVLTLAQLGELVFSPPARPEDRGNILTRVFDFLLQSSNRDKLKGFIPSLQTQARKANFSCENYRVIFDRMDQALSPLAPNQTEALLMIRDSVMMIPPDECIERTAQCTTIPVNESVLCANVSSSALDQFLNGTAPNTTGVCDFTVLQFACLPTLSQLNSQQVADLLACKLSSNVTKETWKLFFTKISTNLDEALVKFSNKTLSASSVALSDVLDVIADTHISRFSPQRLRDPVFIQSWFQGRLKAFLPSVSQRLLSCFSTRNFTCESYRTIYVELNSKFGLMDSATQRFVLNEFIRPFLSRQYNTGVQCTLPFNNSVDFILQNFGSFSPLALLQDFSSLSRNFSAVDALPVLTLAQLGELVFSPPARPEDRGNILTRVFDFLLQSSNRDKLKGFIPSLQTQARKANFSCENYRVIFDRMDQALSPLAPNQTEALLMIRDSVMMIPPDECIERTAQCTTIPVNESVLCANVSSSALDQFLNGTAPNTTGVCNFAVLQFACLPTLSQLNSQQVADLLACKLSSNVTKETWKLFFTKISTNLDDALVKFSNKTLSASSVALSDVLDVITDARISRFSPQRLRDPVFIQSWFQGRLKAFLPSVSQRLLSCFSTRNFTCESYRTIYVELNSKFGLMDSATQRFVLNEFIRPFLSRQYNTGVQCTLPFNNSVDFILQNFGSFSPLALLQDFSSLSRNFSAVDALPVLTLAQLGELVFSPPARPEDRGNILTRVFDFLLQSSNRDKLKGFFPSLQTQARKANFSCENYRVIFDRMDQALSPLAPNQTEALLMIRDSVMMIPPDECIERTAQCTTIPVNESVLCANVSSSALDQFLNGTAPNTTGVCDFTVLQFACLPTLSQLNSQQVADLLACKLSSNVTKETWKLFFTKISTNLDDALVKFSNKTLSASSVALSDVLDVIADARISRFSPQRLRDPVFIQSWFQGRLKAFLPSVSQRLLSCFSTRNFTCESYRTIYVELNSKFGLMDSATQRFVLNEFIRPFLSRQYNTGVQCTLPFNNSVDFILQNFGSFSPLALLQDFSSLSRNFSAVDALPVLTLAQLGELVFSPPARPEDRGNILTRVFDFLLQSSNRDKLKGFIPSLQTQARKANFSCENYRVIFDRMDQALSPLAPNQTEALLMIRDSVMMIPPDECIERTAQCTTIPVNESVLCANVSSSALDQFLSGTAPNTTGVCNFTVLQFACLPTLSQLNSQQVADLLACKLSSNVTKRTWKLFFTKISTNLDDALVKFSNKTLSESSMALSDVLDVIADTRISRFSPQRLRDPVFIQSWFQGRLKHFLPSVSQRLLSCLSTKNLTCEAYRAITTTFVNAPLRDGQDICSLNVTEKQQQVYTDFMKAFLSRKDIDDPGCLKDTSDSAQWVTKNFGPFVQSAPLTDLVTLNKNFTAVDVLPQLGLKQLAEFSRTPGALTTLQNVTNVMQYVKDCQLPAFFDLFSEKVQEILPTLEVKTALIKNVFDRPILSNLSITNQEVVVWLQKRLNPLLANFSESLVSPFFTILNTRDCNITQTALVLLDAVRPSLPIITTNAIYNNILNSFKGPQPLRCYISNSFIKFLNESLYGFGPLPDLATFLTLIPPTRKSELINSIAPSELGSYLRQPKVVNNDSQTCAVFNSFTKTPEFLETEEVPDNVKSTILPCVWPLALTSDNETEADLWFNRRLKLYLKFLNKDLMGSNDTLNASCQSYKTMVGVLGSSFNFTGSQITKGDVYATIKTYLKTDAEAKCYSSTDAKLSSTAWFVNYIGVFITSLTLDDLYSFGPDKTMKIFAVNSENIKLFNQKELPKKVISRYTELIFLQNSSFNLFELPSVLQCDAPVSAFTTLSESQANTILGNFKTSCSDVDPAISTALTGHIKTIDASTITTLGSQIVGLTTTQINSAPPGVLVNSVSTLGNMSGWSLGQAKAIVEVLLSENFKIETSSTLLTLGSLIGGIPSTVLTIIQPAQILETSKNTEFVKNIVAAPEIVQKTVVNQIIKVGSTPSVLMTNVPSDLASQIPRQFLDLTTTVDVTVLQEFNKKKWKPEQAVLFFDSVAEAFTEPDNVSVEVLQGFTCSRVQTFTQTKIKGLIKACRPRSGRNRVVLSETQLTCMYSFIRKEPVVDFENYPSDVLLYFDYGTINKTLCKAYFTQVGAADLSIFSSTLNGRKEILLSNAIDCLGINRTSIKKQDLTVLGNLNDLARFMKTFLKFVRGRNTPKLQMKKLFQAIIVTSTRTKRAASDCIKGNITSVIINDDSFPFGYTEAQFGHCLSSTVVKENLASLCEKIDDSAFQRIILDKLKEVQPNGLSEDQVQVLKSVSRNATVDEISKWNITKSDTLAALMNANDGDWSSAQSELIITKYLSAKNNLTATEINLVKGPNLCSLNASVLSTILPEDLRGSDALNVVKCSSEKKKALFTIANKAFPISSTRSSRSILSAYQLIESYLAVLKMMGTSFLSADRARSPPVKVLSSQLREGKESQTASGKSEYVIRRLGPGEQRSLQVSVVWMQGTVLEVQSDLNTALILDETGNFVVSGINNVPKGKPCLSPGKYVMVMGVIQSHNPEPLLRAVKMADLSENALIHRKNWIYEVEDLQQILP